MEMAAIIMSDAEENPHENEFISWHEHYFESDLISTFCAFSLNPPHTDMRATYQKFIYFRGCIV